MRPATASNILGFSRGAAAARSLSGLAEIFGVLPKGLMDRLPVAWAYYNMAPGRRNLRELFRIDRDLAAIARVGEDLRRAHVGDAGTEGAESPRLRELLRGRHPQELFGPEGLTPIPASDTPGVTYTPLPLHFLGVWDTVFHAKAEGFHESRLAWNVGTGCHALALHEVRKDFVPSLWTTRCAYQEIVQTWFVGAHSDIGGGNGNTGLSAITFEWMVRRASAHRYQRKSQALGFDSSFVERHLGPQRADTPVSYPQFDFPFNVRDQKVRRIGGHFQFRSVWVDRRKGMSAPRYAIAADDLLVQADRASHDLPTENFP
jgi:hypothetical protein